MNKNYQKKVITISLIVVGLFVIIFIGVFFGGISRKYKENTYAESTSYLKELNNQLDINIVNQLNRNWQIIDSVATSIQKEEFSSTDDITNFINKQVEIWSVEAIYIVNEEGYSIDENGIEGRALNNDEVTQQLVNASKSDDQKSFDIKTGNAFFAKFIQTANLLNGKKIIGVILIQSLNTILENDDMSSYNDAASLYLTSNNGIIFSRLTDKNPTAFNIYETFNDTELSQAKKVEIIDSNTQMVFTIEKDLVNYYVVISPIKLEYATFKLFYFVPIAVVNETMNNFYTFTTIMSIVFILIILIIIVLIFIKVYRGQSDKLIFKVSERERLFDLLVTETNNIFALMKLGQKTPVYVTSNYTKIFPKEFISFHKINDHILINDDSRVFANNEVNSALASWDGKSIFSSPFLQLLNSPEERIIVFTLYPVANFEDEYIIIFNDVTKEREHEKALRDALNAADAANKAKTEFLSSMSHDIRTPMNAIVNMTNFAIDHIDQKEVALEYLATVKKSSQHLLSLINNVLEVSRIESGKAQYSRENFDLLTVANNIKDIITALCKVKDHNFICDFDSIIHQNVIGDAIKLEQALINILNNAVKFTNNGGNIFFKIEELDSLRSEVVPFRFTIRDNGVGIKEDDLTRIFAPFVRIQELNHNQIEGTGLGLTITKNFIEGMGGKLSVESTYGEGSTFIIELSFERSTYVKKEIVSKCINPISLKNKKALLVEDNEINQAIAMLLLNDIGLHVDVANNGLDAITMYQNASDNYYDIIYMDIQMPIMNGYEATDKIRASNKVDSLTIPIIAMTANVFIEDIEKARSHQMTAHIGKPINKEDLIDITNRVLKGEENK